MASRGRKGQAKDANVSKILTGKARAQYKHMLKFQDAKQWKKAFKAAERVLALAPNHGETLAVKGLIVQSMGDPVEAERLIKLGIRHDMRSVMCWRAYGIYHQRNRNWAEAAKCFSSAVRMCPEKNYDTVRDMANMHLLDRDWSNHANARHDLLIGKADIGSNWPTAVWAHALDDHPDAALAVMKAWREASGAADSWIEAHVSEWYAFRNYLIQKRDGVDAAITDWNDEAKAHVTSASEWAAHACRLLLEAGRYAEAEPLARTLLAGNTENRRYHTALQQSLSYVDPETGKVRPDQVTALTATYDELVQAYPRSKACKRILLDVTQGNDFGTRLSSFVRPMLCKGVPSLFATLASLYEDAAKVDIIHATFVSFLQCLREKGKFHDNDVDAPPTAELWTMFFLAQHYDKVGDYERALSTLEDAITHTPTIIDLYVVKAKVVKHLGNLDAAADMMNRARLLDTADRWLNFKCTQYLLRANRVQEAVDVASLFSRDLGESNLHQMQCHRFEREMGHALHRLGRSGEALKMYAWVHKHWNDHCELATSFPHLVTRGVGLEAFHNYVQYCSSMWDHRSMFESASAYVRILLQQADTPHVSIEDQVKAAKLSPKSTKRLRRQLRQAEAKQQKKEAAERQAALERVKARGHRRNADSDPLGEKLLHVDDPLQVAHEWVSNLRRNSPNRLATHELVFDIAMRRNKVLVALRALKAAQRLFPDAPIVHVMRVQFVHYLSKGRKVSDLAGQVLELEKASVGGDQDVSSLQDAFVAKYCQASIAHRLAAASALLRMGKPKEDIKEARLTLLSNVAGMTSKDERDAVTAWTLLQEEFPDAEATKDFKAACDAMFKYSPVFGNEPIPMTQEDIHDGKTGAMEEADQQGDATGDESDTAGDDAKAKDEQD